MSDDGNEELKKSILSLLGLDLVERLQADLKIYRSKFLKGGSTDSFDKEIAALEGQLELVEANIRKLHDDKASSENSIQQLTARIADYRDKMSAQGEGYYRNRVSLEEKKCPGSGFHDAELNTENASLRSCSIAFPFSRKGREPFWELVPQPVTSITLTIINNTSVTYLHNCLG